MVGPRQVCVAILSDEQAVAHRARMDRTRITGRIFNLQAMEERDLSDRRKHDAPFGLTRMASDAGRSAKSCACAIWTQLSNLQFCWAYSLERGVPHAQQDDAMGPRHLQWGADDVGPIS